MAKKKTGKKTGARAGRTVAVAAILVAASVYVYGRGPGGWFGAEESVEVEGAPVRRGPLSISITERGNLEARDAISLRCEVEGRTTILSMVPEGTIAEPGMILAELDTASLVDRLVQQEDKVLTARAAFTKAKANLEIQQTENESQIARAKLEVAFAEVDLKKFVDGDWPQQIQKAEEDILLSEEELANAKDQFTWSEDLHAGGFLTRTELDRDELSYKRAAIMLDQARRAKQLMLDFEHDKELKRLEGEFEDKKRELKKVELQATAQTVDQETAVLTAEARLKLEEKELAKIKDQIDKATIRAPVAGMVVYGREDGGRWRGENPVQEGGEIRERQEVISIPRSGGMIAKASVHESVLKQVQVGQEVIVRVDAMPSREFRGRVDYVAVLPDQNSWFANPNLRLYKTEISIADEDSQMRPGMSCSVEILVDQIADTLYVPIQGVVHRGGDNYCFVANGGAPEQRKVVIGPHNSKWVAIESGLVEGDIVMLSAPESFLRDTDDNRSRLEREPGAVGGDAPSPAGEAAGAPEGATRPQESFPGAERGRGDGAERPSGEGSRGGERGGDRGGERGGGGRPQGGRGGEGGSARSGEGAPKQAAAPGSGS